MAVVLSHPEWWIDHPDVPKPVLVDVGARVCVTAASAQAGATGAGARAIDRS